MPIFIDRTFTGLYTQRAVLHDPSDIYTSRYYGGRPDALWMGLNIELTNRLTLQRRPGLTSFSTFPYPTVPDREFSFQLTDGSIRVIIDTGSSGSLSISAAGNSSGGNTVYTGTFPAGAGNAYVGLIFQITGFVTNPVNNGSYACVASTATTLTLANPSGVAETRSATAITSGGVYWDQQNGSAVLLFGKALGAGQAYFTAVSGVLYIGDGVDTKKYTPLNSNATVTPQVAPQPSTTTNTIWNWGGLAPTVAPAITLKSSGSAGGTWQASTWFSTMGLIVDANGNIWQLHKIINPLVTVGTVGSVGTSSNGGPNWNFTPGQTTPDNTVTWRCLSAINARVPGGQMETETTAYSSNVFPCAYYEQISGNIYVCIHTTAGQNNFNGPVQGLTLQPGQSFPDGNNVMMSIGNANNIPNGYCQGQWKPSQVIPSQANPPIRLIIPFQIPRPGSPLTQALFLFEQTVGGTTSSSGVIFTANPTPGVTTITEPSSGDATLSQLQWVNVYAANNSTGKWVTGASYPVWTSPTNFNFGVMVDNNGSFWVAVQQGATGALVGISGLTDPVSVAGYYWQANHVYAGGTIIIDSNSNRQQVQGTGGTSGGVAPTWNRNQGQNTTDNGVTWKNLGSAYGTTIPDGSGTTAFNWVNVGRDATWTANQKFYLPTQGWYAPSNGALGSVNINDGTNSEFVVQTGLSGSSVPTWNTSTQAGSNETYDPSPAAAGGVVWYNNGAFSQNSLSWTKSHTWAYSYKNRTLTDFYSAVIPPASAPPTPPGLLQPLPPPTGAQNNTITTASPATTVSGANPGTVVTVYGNYSSDLQFDTIVIWRDPDGTVTSAQNPAGMLELTEIPNIPGRAGTGKYIVNGVLFDWAFQDFLPDVPSAQFPGLNPLIPAPINHQNDPPPSSYRPMVYNFQRIWGSYLLQVNFSGGPDVATGNPNEAFILSDELPFLAPVQRLIQTPQGLVAMTTNSVELIAGGPQTLSFYSVKLSANMGLLSFNALDIFAGEIFFFTADNQFFVLSPSLSVSNFGFPLGDQFANLATLSGNTQDTSWDPSKVYVAVHQSGIDNCIFICDGSTGWYRLNPRQIPGAAQGPEPIWSPFAKITGGAQLVQSIEFAPGKKTLLVGSTTPGTSLSKRTLGVYTDNGSQYDAFFVMGAVVLAHPGQLGLLKFLECDFSGQSFRPTVSYLLNEISGTYTPFTAIPTFDPPSLYGQRLSPASYSPNRYYFLSNASLARCRFLLIKVDYGQTPNGDEIYDMTIYGRIVVEL